MNASRIGDPVFTDLECRVGMLRSAKFGTFTSFERPWYLPGVDIRDSETEFRTISSPPEDFEEGATRERGGSATVDHVTVP